MDFVDSIAKLGLLCSICLVGSCGGDSGGATNNSAAVNGMWDGTVNEQGLTAEGTVRALIYEGFMYFRRDDQAMFGELILLEDNTLEIELQYFPYTTNDTTNNEYVGEKASGAERIQANGILSDGTGLVFDYVTLAGNFGTIDVTNDGLFDARSQLTDVVGSWTSTDGSLVINDAGAFLGNNPTSGCNFEGIVSELNPENTLFSIIISRNNCSGFNSTEAEGFITIQGDGNLEIYAIDGNELLFMTFSPATTAGGNATTP